MIYYCEICNKKFEDIPSKKRKYCNSKCMGLAKRKRIKINCKQCGKTRELTPTQYKRVRNHFCSEGCYRKSRRKKIEVICKNCSNKFLAKPSTKRKYCSPECTKASIEWKKRQRQAKLGKPGYWLGKNRSEETKKRVSQGLLGNAPWNKGKTGIYSDEVLKKMLKSLKKRPNKLEQVFDDMTPDMIRYVGNRAWWRKLADGKHHNPDFKITGMDKVIEVYGDYWHRNDNPKDLINLYRQANLDCLVVWENEIYNQPDKVLERTIDFISS